MTKKRGNNEGTVYKRPDGLWCAQITLPNGRRKTKYAKGQKAVQDWLIEQRGMTREGTWSESNATLGEFLDSYLDSVVKTSRRPKTYENYEQFARLHIIPEIGRLKLSALQPAHIQSFYSRKLETLSNGTVRAIHAFLHRSLEQAVKWGMVTRNASDAVEQPRPAPHKSGDILSEEELDAFLSTSKGTNYYAMWVLAITTGMRRGEIIGLRWSDVDLVVGKVNVEQTAQRVKGQGMVMSELKTKSSRRTVDIPLVAVEALQEHRVTSNTELVFVSERGHTLTGRTVHYEFKQAIRKAKCKDVTFHSLRHLHATLLMKANVHPKVVQARLGHARINMTLDLYSHIQPGMQKSAVDEMERVLRSVQKDSVGE